MSDRRSQTADGREAVLNAQIPLQAPDFGQVIEGVNESHCRPARDRERTRHDPQSLTETVRGDETHFPVCTFGALVGNGSKKSCPIGFPENRLPGARKASGRGVRQSHVSVEPGRNQAAGDRLDDVLVQGLKFSSAPLVSFSLTSTWRSLAASNPARYATPK